MNEVFCPFKLIGMGPDELLRNYTQITYSI